MPRIKYADSSFRPDTLRLALHEPRAWCAGFNAAQAAALAAIDKKPES